jgi:hypothetical protein
MFIDLKKRKSDYIIGKTINKSAYFFDSRIPQGFIENILERL